MRIICIEVIADLGEAGTALAQLRDLLGRREAPRVEEPEAPGCGSVTGLPAAKEKAAPSKKAERAKISKARPMQDLVRKALADGPKTPKEIRARIAKELPGVKSNAVSNATYMLRLSGAVKDLDDGRRALVV